MFSLFTLFPHRKLIYAVFLIFSAGTKVVSGIHFIKETTMRTLYALTALTALLAAAPAMAEETVTNQSQSTFKAQENGGFDAKSTAEHTDAAGTATSQTMEKKVEVDDKGNRETTAEVKTTTDPKGLFNKQTTKVENKAAHKDGKNKYSHKKSVNGTTVEDTTETTAQ